MIGNLLYLDPGTGLAIMAFILSAIAGFGMFIRTKWDKIKCGIDVFSDEIRKSLLIMLAHDQNQ